ncbi:hypothetical protein ABPG72_018639 [Tetrahymena utriculariae]
MNNQLQYFNYQADSKLGQQDFYFKDLQRKNTQRLMNMRQNRSYSIQPQSILNQNPNQLISQSHLNVSSSNKNPFNSLFEGLKESNTLMKAGTLPPLSCKPKSVLENQKIEQPPIDLLDLGLNDNNQEIPDNKNQLRNEYQTQYQYHDDLSAALDKQRIENERILQLFLNQQQEASKERNEFLVKFLKDRDELIQKHDQERERMMLKLEKEREDSKKERDQLIQKHDQEREGMMLKLEKEREGMMLKLEKEREDSKKERDQLIQKHEKEQSILMEKLHQKK